MPADLITTKHTSLESSPKVVETLHWKMQALKDQERPLEEGISDYIGFTLDNLQQSITSKKFYINELQKLIKADEVQAERIKLDGVQFLEQMGVERLEGHIVSSVTVTKAKAPQTKEKRKLKYLVPVEEIETLLVQLGKAEYETVVTSTKAIPPRLRVTQRQVKNVEVES